MPHARRYKYAGNLGEFVRDAAKKAPTPPAKLTFDLAASERIGADIQKLRGRSGTLIVRNVNFEMKVGTTDMSESYVLAAAELDNGDMLDSEACQSLLELHVKSIEPQNVSTSDVLDIYLRRLTDKLHDEVKERNTEVYLDKKDILERQYKDKTVEYEIKIDKLSSKVRELEKQERQAQNNEERLRIASERQVQRKKIRALKEAMFALETTMEDEISDKIALAQQATEGEAQTSHLFEINFSIT